MSAEKKEATMQAAAAVREPETEESAMPPALEVAHVQVVPKLETLESKPTQPPMKLRTIKDLEEALVKEAESVDHAILMADEARHDGRWPDAGRWLDTARTSVQQIQKATFELELARRSAANHD